MSSYVLYFYTYTHFTHIPTHTHTHICIICTHTHTHISLVYLHTLTHTFTHHLRTHHTHSEVRQSLSNAQAQYSQWCMLLDSEADIDKIQGVGSELKNCIKSIEWDLEDLDQTISILFRHSKSLFYCCYRDTPHHSVCVQSMRQEE